MNWSLANSDADFDILALMDIRGEGSGRCDLTADALETFLTWENVDSVRISQRW